MGVKPGGRTDEPLRPLLLELDTASGQVLRQRSWDTPVHHGAGADVHQEFTAAARAPDGTVWQPTHTELLRIDPRDLSVVQQVDHPLFHGLHSASCAANGDVLLSAAGIDSVLRLSSEGELLEHAFLQDRPFADAFPGITDFRRVPYDGLKPHAEHPNHAVEHQGRVWVTCFETRRARALDPRHPDTLELPDGIPHDGRPYGGLLWFTLTHGVVVAIDPHTGGVVHRIDLAALDPEPGLLGWCRGLAKMGDRLFVGMTMLRRPRHREVLRWMMKGPSGRKRPSRVVEIDLRGPRIVQQIPVGNRAGGTIYGLLPMVAGAAG